MERERYYEAVGRIEVRECEAVVGARLGLARGVAIMITKLFKYLTTQRDNGSSNSSPN